MRAEEAMRLFEECFRDRVKQNGSLSQAAELAGYSSSFFSGQMSDQGPGLNMADALLALERLGDDLCEEVLHTALNRLGTDPALILLAARENQKIAPDLYFREALPRLQALIAAGPTADGEWSTRAGKIAKLDKLRRRDRQTAKVKLQELISYAIERMEKKGERPPQAYGELAAALEVLAALQRLAGRRDDALDLLLAARSLSLLANDLVAEGEWFLKAAFLLVDLSRNSRAYQFLMEANSLFFLAGQPVKQAETVITRGYVLTHAGLHAESRRLLEQVLPLLAADQIEARLSTHQLLAGNLLALRELESAREHLELAVSLVGEDELARACCLWRRANLLHTLGELPLALASYSEALPLYAKLTGAAQLAEMAMEYAKVLMQEGRRPELRRLAADLSGWLKELRGYRKLRDAIDDFTSLVVRNELNERSFAKVVHRIKEAKALSYRRGGLGNSMATPQPNGG